MSQANATPAQLEDALDRLHHFATELSLLTVDMRKGRQLTPPFVCDLLPHGREKVA